jgi:hypothetical protein
MEMTAKALMARALYANWCETCNGADEPGDEPLWPEFEAGNELNPVGLSRKDFEEDAANLLAAIDSHGFVQDLLDAIPDLDPRTPQYGVAT